MAALTSGGNGSARGLGHWCSLHLGGLGSCRSGGSRCGLLARCRLRRLGLRRIRQRIILFLPSGVGLAGLRRTRLGRICQQRHLARNQKCSRQHKN